MDQLTDFKSGKEYNKAVHYHPAYLTSMQSISCKMLDLDESQAGIEIAGRNISNLRYADDTTSMAKTEEEIKSLLIRLKEENEKKKSWNNIQKTKIIPSSSITLWQTEGEKV